VSHAASHWHNYNYCTRSCPTIVTINILKFHYITFLISIVDRSWPQVATTGHLWVQRTWQSGWLLTSRHVWGIHVVYLVVVPGVWYCHPVLRQSSCLIWADDCGRAKRFDAFQGFDETVLLGHSLRSQRQYYLHRRLSSYAVSCSWDLVKHARTHQM